MKDEQECCLGQMSAAQVVQCAEGSNTYCWIAAQASDEAASYECCGGGGRKARFSMRRGFLEPKSIDPDEVPDGLVWTRRAM